MSAITTIRQKFNDLMKLKGIKLEAVPLEEAAPVEMKATAKLKDGTEVYSTGDDFVEGGDFFVAAENGPAPAPDGEHTLVDGRVVVVADGKITEVRVAVEEDMSAEQLLAASTELMEKLSAATTELEAVKTELAAIKAKDSEKATQIVSLKAQISQLEKEPAVKSVTDKSINLKKETPKVEKTWEQMTVAERITAARLKATSN